MKSRMNIYIDSGVKGLFEKSCRRVGKKPSWVIECFMRVAIDGKERSYWVNMFEAILKGCEEMKIKDK